MTGISKNFEDTLFYLNLLDRAFLTFQILKLLHKFEFKSLVFN